MRVLRALRAWLARGYWLVAAPPVRTDARPAETTDPVRDLRGAINHWNRRTRPVERHWN